MLETPQYLTEWMDNLPWYHKVFLKMAADGPDADAVRHTYQTASYTTKPSDLRRFNEACDLFKLNHGNGEEDILTADDEFVFYNE